MPRIRPERLLSDLRTLRTFGGAGKGVVRPTLSPADIASRRWLAGRMRDAGMTADIDGIGNVVGRSHLPGPVLLLGSHSDTQPQGGWLDGAMGVIYAIEVARAFAESADTAHLAIDVASWNDEEGTFIHYGGSRAFCGDLCDAEIDSAVAEDGRTLRAALNASGLTGRPVARLNVSRHAAYLEAHIEQGPVLEAAQKQIGVVTSIVGAREYLVRFEGQRNHAGTTPMRLRRDAAAALFRFVSRIDALFRKIASPETVWTLGYVKFEPNAPSIVPGAAELSVQFRSPDSTVLMRLAAAVLALRHQADGENGVQISRCDERISFEPTPMTPYLRAAVIRAADTVAPGRWMELPSGAGHDAQILCAHIPTAMLFIPSIGGVSHAFDEDSLEDDIILGCQVLAEAAHAVFRSEFLEPTSSKAQAG